LKKYKYEFLYFNIDSKEMKIAIIGGGWFGCHIGNELLKEGHEIVIYEREREIFSGASGANQNRLHLGYHYPRSHITREQSKKGFNIFKKKYSYFSKKIKNNIYAISSEKESIIDFETYIQILKSSRLPFKVLDPKKNEIKNIEGLIKCPEEYIDIYKVKSFFEKKLRKNIIYNFDVKKILKKKDKILINNNYYDFVVNCTWQQLYINKKWKLKYELCISTLYKAVKNFDSAITIMDGPFFTLYPWGSKQFNLYSVKHSRYKNANKFEKIKYDLKKIKREHLNEIRRKMENEFSHYYPDFKKKFKFIKFLKTFRTIIERNNHSRNYQYSYNDRVFNILSGKVDHIFLAYTDLKKCLRNFL